MNAQQINITNVINALNNEGRVELVAQLKKRMAKYRRNPNRRDYWCGVRAVLAHVLYETGPCACSFESRNEVYMIWGHFEKNRTYDGKGNLIEVQ